MKKELNKILGAIIITIFIPFIVGAQSDGTAPIDPTLPPDSTTKPDPSSTGTPVDTGTTTPEPGPTPTPSGTTTLPEPSSATELSPDFVENPLLSDQDILDLSADDSGQVETIPTENSNNLKIILISIFTIGLGTVILMKLSSKKVRPESDSDSRSEKEDKKDDSKCLNFKKLIEEKLNELTDLKGKLSSLAKDEAKEQVKKLTLGTDAEKVLTLIENTKKDYERLKELYEKCITDVELNKSKIYFIRHGESEANTRDVFAGQRDDSLLTEKGKLQARATAKHIQEQKIIPDRIVSSPLKRSLETAQIIADVIGFDKNKIEIDKRITEYDMGSLTGTPIKDISSLILSSAENAEDTEKFKKRVVECIKEISTRSEVVLIASHAGVGRILETIKERMESKYFYDLKAWDNASVTKVDWVK